MALVSRGGWARSRKGGTLMAMHEVISGLLGHDRVKAARQHIERTDEVTLARQAALSAIPAPTGAEAQRAARVAELFREAGLGDVRIDEAGNVSGCADRDGGRGSASGGGGGGGGRGEGATPPLPRSRSSPWTARGWSGSCTGRWARGATTSRSAAPGGTPGPRSASPTRRTRSGAPRPCSRTCRRPTPPAPRAPSCAWAAGPV